MSGDDLSDIYHVDLTPIDATVIPLFTTAVVAYFWLRQGTDDEMPEVSYPKAHSMRTMGLKSNHLSYGH